MPMSIKGRVKQLVYNARLSALSRTVRARNLTYLTAEKLWRLEHAAMEVLRAKVPGDVLEFGVALGGSAAVLATNARRGGRRFVGFDVFGMIPPPVSEMDDERSRERYYVISGGSAQGLGGGRYYGYEESLEERVASNLAEFGVAPDGRSVRLIKGLFSETWSVFDAGQVCFAHVDCDWYDPVRFCLQVLRERVSPGGVIVVDDYYDYGGCRTAVDEFLSLTAGSFTFQDGPNPILRRNGL